jgi:hypothetical protein
MCIKQIVIGVILLITNNVIGQEVQKDSVVVLTEKQARAVATDLVRYDALKKIAVLQDERINNFQQKEKLFGEQLSIKDTIIGKQSAIIDKQNAVISNTKKMHIHGYGGVQTNELTLTNPSLRGNIMLEYRNYRTGVVYTIQQSSPANWGILFEYKLF